MRDLHIYLIWDKVKNRPYYVGKWGGIKNKDYITGSTYLRRYINRFGLNCFWQRFEKSRLETVILEEQLNEREEFYIKQYNTFKNGGNRTKGGNYDWKYRLPKRKPIVQYTLQGDFIREWEFAKQPVYEGLQVSYTGISACITGHQESAGGYIWKLKTSSEFSKNVDVRKRVHAPKGKEVLHFSKEGTLLGTYDSPKVCSKQLNIPYTLLTQILRGTRGPRYGEIFKYSNTEWQKLK